MGLKAKEGITQPQEVSNQQVERAIQGGIATFGLAIWIIILVVLKDKKVEEKEAPAIEIN